MAQTKDGVIKLMAKKSGVSVQEFNKNQQDGLKWCYKCKSWLPCTEFGIDKSRWDGRFAICRSCRHVKDRKKRRLIAPSEKVRNQASNAVRTAIKQGRMVRADKLPCFYCTGKAVEYHHYKGYSERNWLNVKAACKKCHNNLHWE